MKLKIRNLKLEWGLALLLIFPSIGKTVEGVRLVCDAPEYNFGTVDQSAVITNVFVIRNEGDLTFAAGMPRTTCSCTQARISKRMIGPGETAEVTAVFTAARRSGKQSKAIILPAADSPEIMLKLYMKGVIDPPSPAR